MQDSDLLLLRRIAQQRDVGAFEALYEMYRRRLGAFIYRIVQDPAAGEEIYNDVMMAVWSKAASYNGKSKLSTWIFAIAYRQGLNRLRGQRSHCELDESSLGSKDEAGDFEQQQLVRIALLRLSPEHRMVIELSYYQGYNYREIGEIAGCPENTVKTRMFHARRHMRAILAEIGGAGQVEENAL